MKKLFCTLTLTLISLSFASTVQAGGFDSYNTLHPYDSYFASENKVPEYYIPRTMNPMIAMLPEYSMMGPGYVCDTRQAPPVYRLPLQYRRNVGYREADWFNNRLVDRHIHNMNFGGYDY
ncbi:MAG TPA: hypothetical protein V6C96_02340 [Vampirovibrionales bacterium]